MQNSQKRYLTYLSHAEKIVSKIHAADPGLLPDALSDFGSIKADLQNRELIIPVVGAFSAGKSSMLNAILGDKHSILPVAIQPETAIATELRYDSRERIETIDTHGKTEELPLSELGNLDERASDLEFIRLYLDNQALKNLQPIILVDMPGFNSPLDAHNKAISNYITKGAHYIFVISAEEGTIQKSILEQIHEIDTMGRTFSICINKSDLRPPSEVENIRQNIEESLEIEGFTVKACRISKNEPNLISSVIESINPDAIYTHIFRPQLQQTHSKLEDQIHQQLESYQLAQDKAVEVLNQLKGKLQSLQEQSGSVGSLQPYQTPESRVSEIMRIVHNRLHGAIDDMAQAALRGSTDIVSRILSDEVRGGLIEGARQVSDSISSDMVMEFSYHASQDLPLNFQLSKDWTDDLLANLQNNLLPALLSSDWLSMLNMPAGKGAVAGSAVGILASNIGKIAPHPILKIAIPIVTTLLGGWLDNWNQGRKLENIKDAIRTQLIPNVERQLRTHVHEFVIKAQEQVNQYVKSQFEKRLQEQQQAIEKATQDTQASSKEAAITALQAAQGDLRNLAATYF